MIRTKRTTRKRKARLGKMAISSTTRRRKTKKKTRSNRYALPPWHPPALVPPSKLARSNLMHRPQWITILCTAVFVASFSVAFVQAQEPVPAPSSPAATAQASAATRSKPGKRKYSHINDFLIHGTVFTDKALSFPGVQLRLRRAGEKKFRWESYTNSRGEFAVRVPQGSEYEMVVRAKNFADQIRTIDARTGSGENNVVFRMEPAKKGKQ